MESACHLHYVTIVAAGKRGQARHGPGVMVMAQVSEQDRVGVDSAEIAKFEAMAEEWWNPNGKFRPLHMMNPCRLRYAVAQITAQHGRDPKSLHPLTGLRILDIGCGGGLLSEPMARLGAEVVGADAAARNIPIAQLHADRMGLAIDYRVTTAEALAEAGEQFDAVLNMEVVEHVPDPQAFLEACAVLVRPGGLMITSTINRNPKSYAVAIVGAEHIMRWLPRGTHDWAKFITPDELQGMLGRAGLEPVDAKGFVFNPLRWEWRISERDLSVNYVTTGVKRG
jgi:2-polyprenyl-6-hydroxyphenyl methylase/3-demethylubiquinone-9 3-methyltransferase